MIIDGEELKFKCKVCGHKFTYIIGYGPVCPTPWLRYQRLKENPPRCPKCSSLAVKRSYFWNRFFE